MKKLLVGFLSAFCALGIFAVSTSAEAGHCRYYPGYYTTCGHWVPAHKVCYRCGHHHKHCYWRGNHRVCVYR